MKKEVLNQAPRELNFYGEGKAESIKRGFAITSLRNPSDRYSFSRGERILANCQDDGEKVPVVVISNNLRPLSEHEIPVLALDGAFSPEQAAEMLKGYPTYEATTVDSPMQAIVFMEAAKYDSLPKDLQERVVNPNIPIISLLEERESREIFFPTMCYWLSELGGNFLDWTSFLEKNQLITAEEKEEMGQSWRDHHKRRTDEERYEAYLATTPGYLHSLSLNVNENLFRLFVLGLPNKVES